MLACVLGGCAWQSLPRQSQPDDAAFVQRLMVQAQADEAAGDLLAAIARWRVVALLDGAQRAETEIHRLEGKRRELLAQTQGGAEDDPQQWLRLLLLDAEHPAALQWFAQRDEAQLVAPLVFTQPPPASEVPSSTQARVSQPDDTARRVHEAQALYRQGRRMAANDLRAALTLYQQALKVHPEHAAARRALQQTQRMLENLEAIRGSQ